MTCIIEKFLLPIKSASFTLIFFHCEKDKSEISAIRKICPEVMIRLCYRHAKRAIRNKLKENKKTRSQNHYYPIKAKALVPRIMICWGSYSTWRPGGHKHGRCECNSAKISFEENGSMETSTVSERDIMLVMFSRHFSMLSMIPDQNSTYHSAEQIHVDCINEIYASRYSRNYFRLWTYLFMNWFAPDQWKFWVRSASPSCISVLKTAIIVESHWRRIKHDYHYRYNRPRMDPVDSVLTPLVIPEAVENMNEILSKNRRKARAALRKVVKNH